MNFSEVQDALRRYLGAFLERKLPHGSLSDLAVDLLRQPGLALSETPHSVLGHGILLCYGMLSSDDWDRALPAAAAVELTLTAFEIYDKFEDREGWGNVMPQPGVLDLNLASCFQSLAPIALDELRGRGFPPPKVLGAQRALADTVVEYCAVADLDVRREGQWLTLEEALSLVVGKGAGAGGWIGGLGAYLASDDPQVVAACTEFGRCVGAYSQIVNDLNDAMPGATHKSDVRTRKSTIPLVYFLNMPDDEHGQARALLRSEVVISLEQETLVRQAVEASGALDFTAVVAEVYRTRARNALLPLEPSYDTSVLLRPLLAWTEG